MLAHGNRKIARLASNGGNLGQREQLDVDVPADLDQFR
jgi:hypothetical protein